MVYSGLMITIMVSTPDAVLDIATVDPNELDAIRQSILLGVDFLADTGVDVTAALAFATRLRDHC